MPIAFETLVPAKSRPQSGAVARPVSLEPGPEVRSCSRKRPGRRLSDILGIQLSFLRPAAPGVCDLSIASYIMLLLRVAGVLPEPATGGL
jgi:hypothetical protein